MILQLRHFVPLCLCVMNVSSIWRKSKQSLPETKAQPTTALLLRFVFFEFQKNNRRTASAVDGPPGHNSWPGSISRRAGTDTVTQSSRYHSKITVTWRPRPGPGGMFDPSGLVVTWPYNPPHPTSTGYRLSLSSQAVTKDRDFTRPKVAAAAGIVTLRGSAFPVTLVRHVPPSRSSTSQSRCDAGGVPPVRRTLRIGVPAWVASAGLQPGQPGLHSAWLRLGRVPGPCLSQDHHESSSSSMRFKTNCKRNLSLLKELQGTVQWRQVWQQYKFSFQATVQAYWAWVSRSVPSSRAQ